jgi:energy-coupling factor transport system ATP-binding protein
MGLSAEEIDSRVRWAMEKVHLNYDKLAEKSPFELSGGQMRRVAIAGVLAMQPDYLILDEPTAGLDPHGRDRILGIVKDLHEGGTTVVMVSHSMEDMARLATRLLVFADGKLAADGTPGDLFRQPEKMKAVGLDVPEAAQLCALLREKGLDLPEGLFRMKDVRDHLLRLWKEGAGC